MAKSILTASRLRELLRYDPDTGLFTYVAQHAQKMHAGDVAGSINKMGYCYICIDSTKVLAHRLAIFYTTGSWPPKHVDHIDGNPTNNRINNLRNASVSLNLQNQRQARKDNISGFLGVSVDRNGFGARIRIDGKQHYLGFYPSAEKAHSVYLEAKRKLHPGCTI